MKMLLLSAGKGPQECTYAVGLALKRLQQECDKASVKCSIVDLKDGSSARCFQHVIFTLEGENEEAIANSWVGSMLWVCQSPFRKNHKRKNWYFSGKLIDNGLIDSSIDLKLNDVEFNFCKASGAGGQHVNKTDSAVRALHKPSGIQVRIESERSQHSNKRIAIKLLEYKLKQQGEEQFQADNKEAWNSHQNLERGNSVRTFKGKAFNE